MHPAMQDKAEPSMQAAETEAFLELVDSLEVASHGRPLEGAGRAKCLRAFSEAPRGFGIVADRAIEEGRKNPIGLLIWMVERGQHRKAERAAQRNGADYVDEEGIPF
jgi:hypothetical protein